jgi:hypothetical protein
MSTSDDNLYRGDPQPTPPPSSGSSAPAASEPAYGTPPPPPGYAPAPVYQQPAYGQPPYGQPPYGQPYGGQPYGAPGYGPPPGYPGFPRPTNTMAILALVLAFVLAPAGIVLGVIARKQIRQTGEEGDGLALAGIIVGSIFSAFFVLGIVVWVIAIASISSAGGFN